MHHEKFQVDKIQNSHLSPIIHLDMPHIAEYHENRSSSYTITIKQIIRFQGRMHFEKFQLDLIQNGRLSAIIHLDRPHIAEDHENRSR